MAISPQFAATVMLGIQQISTANTNRDGTGTLGTIVSGGGSGTRIDEIVITATVTTTAGMVRLFIDDATNIRLWKEVEVDAVTPSGTVPAFTVTLKNIDGTALLYLPSGYILKAGTNNAETFNVIATGGHF